MQIFNEKSNYHSVTPAVTPKRRQIELADIFRNHAHELENLPYENQKILEDIMNCRTPALGSHYYRCDHCVHEEIRYNSCFNRHCPKCQFIEKLEWMEKRIGEILDLPYFHIISHLPDRFNGIALSNKDLIYSILFRSTAKALKAVVAREWKVKIGITCILHTWGQNLSLHPHVHCMVPGGGLSFDGTRIIQCSDSFFVSEDMIAEAFMEDFLKKLQKAYDNGQLILKGEFSYLMDKTYFKQFIEEAKEENWEIFLKRAVSGPKQILEYIAKYRFKIAIENKRILRLENGIVHFEGTKNHRNGEVKVIQLKAKEFMRRFLLHILPPEFRKVRYYGIFAGGERNEKIALGRKLLGQPEEPVEHADEDKLDLLKRVTGFDATLCPVCKKGHLVKCPPFTKSDMVRVNNNSDSFP